MYFEDSIVFTESSIKILVGCGYFSLGIFGVVINLSALSVLPECGGAMPSQHLTMFSLQLFANIFAIFAVAVPVPYMIATGRSYFLNPLLSRTPGCILSLVSVLCHCLQLCIAVYRTLAIVLPVQTILVFSHFAVYGLVVASFVFAVDSTINIYKNAEPRHFRLHLLDWTQSQFESLFFSKLIVYTAMVTLMFYAMAIFDLLYKHIYSAPSVVDEEKEEPDRPLPALGRVATGLVCDVIYALLFVLPALERDDIMTDMLQIIGVNVWPTLSAIIQSGAIREALLLRVRVMLSSGRSCQQVQMRGQREGGTRQIKMFP